MAFKMLSALSARESKTVPFAPGVHCFEEALGYHMGMDIYATHFGTSSYPFPIG